MERTEVLVIGAGVIGLAVARELAERNVGVIVLEAERPGHRLGSSSGLARMRVLAGYPDDSYVERGLRAGQLWAELEHDSGRRILHRTGCLSWGAGQDELAAALDRHGLPYEEWSPADVRRRVPTVSIPAGVTAIHQADAATIQADQALVALLDGARRRGAEVREEVPVLGLEHGDDGVVVTVPGSLLRADVLVVCAGAWSGSLLEPLGIDLDVTVTAQTVCHFDLAGAGPVPGLIEYGAPDPYSCWSPDGLLKSALHAPGPVVDPAADVAPDPAVVDTVTAWVGERFGPEVAASFAGAEVCRYTSTPDERFVVERHGPVVVVSACSGHGFQYAPDTAVRAADLVTVA